jgi:hypothetical protein
MASLAASGSGGGGVPRALTGRAGFRGPGGRGAPSRGGASAAARSARGSAPARRLGAAFLGGFPDRIRGNDSPSPRHRPVRTGPPTLRPAMIRGAPGRAEARGARHHQPARPPHRPLPRRARRGWSRRVRPGPPRRGRSPRVPGVGDRQAGAGPCAGSQPSLARSVSVEREPCRGMLGEQRHGGEGRIPITRVHRGEHRVHPPEGDDRHFANLHGGDITVGCCAVCYRPVQDGLRVRPGATQTAGPGPRGRSRYSGTPVA